MNNTLWKESTKKAFYGFLAYILLSGIVGSLVKTASAGVSMMSLASGHTASIFGMSFFVGLLAVASYVVYFLGVRGMKSSAVGTPMEKGTAQVYTGTLIGLVGAAIKLLPFGGVISWIVCVVGFVLIMLGFLKIKNLKDIHPMANKGAAFLFAAMIIQLSVYLFSLIPLLGSVLCLLLNIALIVYSILGWSKFTKSEL